MTGIKLLLASAMATWLAVAPSDSPNPRDLPPAEVVFVNHPPAGTRYYVTSGVSMTGTAKDVRGMVVKIMKGDVIQDEQFLLSTEQWGFTIVPPTGTWIAGEDCKYEVWADGVKIHEAQITLVSRP